MDTVCERVVARFAQHIERVLPAAESAAVDRHLGECAECRAAYEETRQVVAELSAGSVGDEKACDSALASAMARIGAGGGVESGAVKRMGRFVAWRRRPAAWAAAAALLLLAGVWAAVVLGRGAGEPHVVWVEAPVSGGLDSGPGHEPGPEVPPRPKESVAVEIRWPVADRPVAGTKIEIVRGGRVIARGRVTAFGRNGTMRARVELVDEMAVEEGDRVRMAR